MVYRSVPLKARRNSNRDLASGATRTTAVTLATTAIIAPLPRIWPLLSCWLAAHHPRRAPTNHTGPARMLCGRKPAISAAPLAESQFCSTVPGAAFADDSGGPQNTGQTCCVEAAPGPVLGTALGLTYREQPKEAGIFAGQDGPVTGPVVVGPDPRSADRTACVSGGAAS